MKVLCLLFWGRESRFFRFDCRRMRILNRNDLYHLSVCMRIQLSSRRAFEFHLCSKWVVEGADPYRRDIFFCFGYGQMLIL